MAGSLVPETAYGDARSPPTSSTALRPSITTFHSDVTAVERETHSTVTEEDEDQTNISDDSRRHSGSGSGLGIAHKGARNDVSQPARRISAQSIARKPIRQSSPTKSPGILSPPTSADAFFGGFPKDSPDTTPDLRQERSKLNYEDSRREVLENARHSSTSLNDYEQYLDGTGAQRVNGAPSVTAYESTSP